METSSTAISSNLAIGGYDSITSVGIHQSAYLSSQKGVKTNISNDNSVRSKNSMELQHQIGGMNSVGGVQGDEWELIVIKFGSEISLRGKLGKYLTANLSSVTSTVLTTTTDTATTTSSSSSSSLSFKHTNLSRALPPVPSGPKNGLPLTTTNSSFVLGIDGQGIGDPLDCFVFVNAENR